MPHSVSKAHLSPHAPCSLVWIPTTAPILIYNCSQTNKQTNKQTGAIKKSTGAKPKVKK